MHKEYQQHWGEDNRITSVFILHPLNIWRSVQRAFIRPTDPSVFIPVPNDGVGTRAWGSAVPLTAVDISTQQVTHKQRKREYNEVQAVEMALGK